MQANAVMSSLPILISAISLAFSLVSLIFTFRKEHRESFSLKIKLHSLFTFYGKDDDGSGYAFLGFSLTNLSLHPIIIRGVNIYRKRRFWIGLLTDRFCEKHKIRKRLYFTSDNVPVSVTYKTDYINCEWDADYPPHMLDKFSIGAFDVHDECRYYFRESKADALKYKNRPIILQVWTTRGILRKKLHLPPSLIPLLMRKGQR